eukprot:Sdes_comp10028_c0_seq1m1618
MVLDLDLFRVEKGGNPDLIRESQRRRHKDVSLVDRVIEKDCLWRQLRYQADLLNKLKNLCSKTVGEKMKKKEPAGSSGDFPKQLLEELELLNVDKFRALTVTQLKAVKEELEHRMKLNDEERVVIQEARDFMLREIGNIVHDSVPVSDNEDLNRVEYEYGAPFKSQGYSHVDLIKMIDGVDTDRGTVTAGNRGYYLKGPCVFLEMALIQYGMNFLHERQFTPIMTPFFMRKEVMQEVAQLQQFDEELYKVTGKGSEEASDQSTSECYLIATSEQPIAAYHRNEWMDSTKLPLRYCGYSTCFRQEVGSHGRDTGGIFRVHQFEKLEQFCITSPREQHSWDMMEQMLTNARDLYEDLGIPYRVVNIVSGALNNAAA